MPTTTTFQAKGRRNGFPFCIPKVDLTSGITSSTDGSVGPADFWVTLGGVSSGTASQAQIDLSLNNAMKLYWNQYSITAGNLSASSSGESSFALSRSSEIQANDKEAIYQKTISEEESDYVPVERACDNPEIQSRGMVFSDRHEDETGDRISRINFSSVAINGRFGILDDNIFRMYNGSTDDESNFVGYGVSNIFLAFTRTKLRLIPASAGSVDNSVQQPQAPSKMWYPHQHFLELRHQILMQILEVQCPTLLRAHRNAKLALQVLDFTLTNPL